MRARTPWIMAGAVTLAAVSAPALATTDDDGLTVTVEITPVATQAPVPQPGGDEPGTEQPVNEQPDTDELSETGVSVSIAAVLASLGLVVGGGALVAARRRPLRTTHR